MTVQSASATPEDFLAEGHTPMMAQYMAARAAAPGCLLFYRMGDFYELFFEDAEQASAVLDIALTRRGRTKGEDIPMCGVPFHSCEPYIARLIRAGHKVAICEQVETPDEARRRGGAKALVRREIVRIATPGTLTEDSLLDARANNYLAALAQSRSGTGLAWVDMSTGDFAVQPVEPSAIPAALARIAPSEILAPESLAGLLAPLDKAMRPTLQPDSLFDPDNARRRLETAFGVTDMQGFGAFTPAETAAAGALIDYVARTQIGKLPHLARPRRIAPGGTMEIDAATRRNLEIARTLSGERRGSLLDTVDRTVTGPGARLLAEWLCAPSCDLAEIEGRLDRVQSLHDRRPLRAALREIFRTLPDMERALARLSAGRGGPRDLGALRDGLSGVEKLCAALDAAPEQTLAALRDALAATAALMSLADTLGAALADPLPFLAREGGFVRVGYHAPLDEALALQKNGRRLMAEMESRYRAETGIETLKIAYNNILGYYIEIPARKAQPLLDARTQPEGSPFIHRQTMAGAVRFTTVALSELEKDVSTAADRALALEHEIFERLCADAVAQAVELARLARAAATLDAAAGLAEIADESGWTRPTLDESVHFEIQAGRHPVVERALKESGTPFVPNGCDLSPGRRLWLLTGPNMAGKSTFLRQNALIAILAQCGSFVPAQAARIGLVDRVFSRVGASDDLARGHSTFMVEMVETAAILNQAGPRALVILDEIGRGTATFDGLSLAWACLEHLHDSIRARVLFATHYHELAALESRLGDLSCHAMQVKEWKGDIVFLHAVGPGAADRSYGLHVARIAGLPAPVIARARALLGQLESGGRPGVLSRLTEDLPLFGAAAASATPPAPEPDPLRAQIEAIDPDRLTPREALELLYALKNAAQSGRP